MSQTTNGQVTPTKDNKDKSKDYISLKSDADKTAPQSNDSQENGNQEAGPQSKCLRLSVHNSSQENVLEMCKKFGSVVKYSYRQDMGLFFATFEKRDSAMAMMNSCRNGEVMMDEQRVHARLTSEQDPALRLYVKAAREALEVKTPFECLKDCVPTEVNMNADKGFAILTFESVDAKRKAYEIFKNVQGFSAFFYRPRQRTNRFRPRRGGFRRFDDQRQNDGNQGEMQQGQGQQQGSQQQNYRQNYQNNGGQRRMNRGGGRGRGGQGGYRQQRQNIQQMQSDK